MKIVFSEECLNYGSPGHPESPERVRLAYEYLKARFEFIGPAPAAEKDILLVHSERHLENLRNLEFYDGDSPQYPDIYGYACLSAGGAITSAGAAIAPAGAATTSAEQCAFSLTRPPGHHAGPSRVAGFCYLNNVAIAVRKLGKRTLILDIDAHHGDGTQAIFLGDPSVVYVSLHRYPCYPGTGLKSQENCFNYPLPPLCGDQAYLETFKRALDSLEAGGFELVAVSAGFDGYRTDPLASLGLTSQAYRKVGELISGLKLPVFGVLEGGYDGAALGPNVEQLLLGLGSRNS
ncbi:MAG: histone deacetylase [Candidatus Eiseniibacteriota bacterium]|nr:MAG: histone deacetylase [Candidatus Eisenbacteria bacterium]